MTASREEREEEERGVDAIVRNQDRRTKTNKVALHFCAFVVRHIPQQENQMPFARRRGTELQGSSVPRSGGGGLPRRRRRRMGDKAVPVVVR